MRATQNRVKIAIPEKVIEAHIRQYLSLKGIFWFKVKTLGVFDPTKRIFRKAGAEYTRGVSDLICIYNGRPLAIEVKAARGRVSPEQALFQERFRKAGGIAFVARSVDEVEAALKHWRSYTHLPESEAQMSPLADKNSEAAP